MVSFQTMTVKASFTIVGDPDSIKDLYSEENWKFHRTENVLKKHPEIGRLFKTPVPLFALLLNKYLQVVNVSLSTPGHRGNTPVIFDQSCDLILLPNNYPPLAGLPDNETYSYYGKKAAIFYSDFILNTRYEVEIELEANAATFEFVPIFPYKTVTVEKIVSSSTSDYNFQLLGIKIRPTHSKHYPEWYEEHLFRHENPGIPKRPNFTAASPFRGEMPLYDVEEVVRSYNPKTEEDVKRIINEVMFLDFDHKKVVFTDYESVRFAAMIQIPEDKDVEVNVRTIQRPLPPRIYEQMQKLPAYQDVLVRYDIFNLAHEKLRLRIETEIIGYTEIARKIIVVPALNNSRGKRSREMVIQCPRLKHGLLETLIKPEKAMMRCVVTNEDTKEALFDETRDIDLLANDEMVWSLKDIRSNTEYDLHDFICAWITPRDREGLIEKVRTESAKLRSSKIFGESSKMKGIESHVRAIYEYLASLSMTYVNQPFSSVSLPRSQRVVLPEVVLKNNAGNCIDLTVLFASVLEGVGIYSMIFLTKDHAFIGWGNKNNADEILFLETTVLGRLTFDEAVKLGREAYEKNFMFKGETPVPIPPFLAAEMLGCHIVDTQSVRYSGKISTRS
ncbi:MAG: hypothetical protein Q7S76_01555 [bacterium]|nr:hypothetical protein [bacterium]